ncbi:hypothetical protein BC937DRAFT_95575 [Endogone sp. FLAS-F59071]|nr:hypothetical protein BC937DRAFT_95575 [Endogone sp. FLAS-F59071]|eukprot:RUS13280.1 hypothetical protein BC937DRAFT_95575 [Endogone sp. FLAS-F59071]
MSTRSELEKVQVTNTHKLDTRDVAERLDNTMVLVVNDKGAASAAVATVAQLTLASTELARIRDFDNVSISVQSPEKEDGILGLNQRLDAITDNQWNLLDLFNAMTAGQDERGEGRCGEGRGGGEALLVQVSLDVPFAPDLGRGEHTTTAAHVTESSLIIEEMVRPVHNATQHNATTFRTLF